MDSVKPPTNLKPGESSEKLVATPAEDLENQYTQKVISEMATLGIDDDEAAAMLGVFSQITPDYANTKLVLGPDTTLGQIQAELGGIGPAKAEAIMNAFNAGQLKTAEDVDKIPGLNVNDKNKLKQRLEIVDNTTDSDDSTTEASIQDFDRTVDAAYKEAFTKLGKKQKFTPQLRQYLDSLDPQVKNLVVQELMDSQPSMSVALKNYLEVTSNEDLEEKADDKKPAADTLGTVDSTVTAQTGTDLEDTIFEKESYILQNFTEGDQITGSGINYIQTLDPAIKEQVIDKLLAKNSQWATFLGRDYIPTTGQSAPGDAAVIDTLAPGVQSAVVDKPEEIPTTPPDGFTNLLNTFNNSPDRQEIMIKGWAANFRRSQPVIVGGKQVRLEDFPEGVRVRIEQQMQAAPKEKPGKAQQETVLRTAPEAPKPVELQQLKPSDVRPDAEWYTISQVKRQDGGMYNLLQWYDSKTGKLHREVVDKDGKKINDYREGTGNGLPLDSKLSSDEARMYASQTEQKNLIGNEFVITNQGMMVDWEFAIKDIKQQANLSEGDDLKGHESKIIEYLKSIPDADRALKFKIVGKIFADRQPISDELKKYYTRFNKKPEGPDLVAVEAAIKSAISDARDLGVEFRLPRSATGKLGRASADQILATNVLSGEISWGSLSVGDKQKITKILNEAIEAKKVEQDTQVSELISKIREQGINLPPLKSGADEDERAQYAFAVGLLRENSPISFAKVKTPEDRIAILSMFRSMVAPEQPEAATGEINVDELVDQTLAIDGILKNKKGKLEVDFGKLKDAIAEANMTADQEVQFVKAFIAKSGWQPGPKSYYRYIVEEGRIPTTVELDEWKAGRTKTKETGVKTADQWAEEVINNGSDLGKVPEDLKGQVKDLVKKATVRGVLQVALQRQNIDDLPAGIRKDIQGLVANAKDADGAIKNALEVGGLTPTELKTEFNVDYRKQIELVGLEQVISSGVALSELKTEGFSATEIVGQKVDVAVLDLHEAGFTYSEIRDAFGGLDKIADQIASFDAYSELKDSEEYDINRFIIEAKLTGEQIKNISGGELEVLQREGVNPLDLLKGGIPKDELLAAGFSESDLEDQEEIKKQKQIEEYVQKYLTGEVQYGNLPEDIKADVNKALWKMAYSEAFNIVLKGGNIDGVNEKLKAQVGKLVEGDDAKNKLIKASVEKGFLSSRDLIDTYAITPTEMKAAGVAVGKIVEGGVSVQELRDDGFDSLAVYDNGNSGVTFEQMREVGFSNADIVAAAGLQKYLTEENDVNILELYNETKPQFANIDGFKQASGMNWKELVDKGFDLKTAIDEGASKKNMYDEGISLSDLHGAGVSFADMALTAEMGVPLARIMAEENGFNPKEVFEDFISNNINIDVKGFIQKSRLQVPQLVERGFSVSDMLAVSGTRPKDLYENGAELSQLRDAGVKFNELVNITNLTTVLNQEFSAQTVYEELKNEQGMTMDSFVGRSHMSVAQLEAKGLSLQMMINEGAKPSTLILSAKARFDQLESAGMTLDKVVADSYFTDLDSLLTFTGKNTQDIYNASLNGAQSSAATIRNFRNRFSVSYKQLTEKGFPLTKLVSEGIQLSDMANEGITMQDMHTAGVSLDDIAGITAYDIDRFVFDLPGSLKDKYQALRTKNRIGDGPIVFFGNRGKGLKDLLASGFTAKDLLDDGATVDQLLASGVSKDDPTLKEQVHGNAKAMARHVLTNTSMADMVDYKTLLDDEGNIDFSKIEANGGYKGVDEFMKLLGSIDGWRKLPQGVRERQRELFKHMVNQRLIADIQDQSAINVILRQQEKLKADEMDINWKKAKNVLKFVGIAGGVAIVSFGGGGLIAGLASGSVAGGLAGGTAATLIILTPAGIYLGVKWYVGGFASANADFNLQIEQLRQKQTATVADLDKLNNRNPHVRDMLFKHYIAQRLGQVYADNQRVTIDRNAIINEFVQAAGTNGIDETLRQIDAYVGSIASTAGNTR